MFPAILVLVDIPIGRAGVVAVLCNVRIFEYPHAPQTKEGVSCEIRSNATSPPVAHMGIGQYPPSPTLPSSKKYYGIGRYPPSRTLPPSKKRFSQQDPCRAIVAGIGDYSTCMPLCPIHAKTPYISSIHTTELSVMN